ncbi:MAG: hypothetical protein JNN13_20490 [Planctomycetes bacterium]|nr:hypothetical protein [Planctomycetota bacterium]
MWSSWLCCGVLVLAPQGGGDQEQGAEAYRQRRFADAVRCFQSAAAAAGGKAELQWNLALAAYGAGDLATAETAAEKYAALAEDAREDLHAGMLGAVRHAEAKALEAEADALVVGAAAPPAAGAGPADPLPVYEKALAKAKQASDYFEKGVQAAATPELLRNAERALRTIEAIEQKIEQQKQQREPSKDDKQEEKKEDKKEDKKNPDEEGKKPDEKKPDDKKPEDKQQGDSKSGDDKQGAAQPPEPKPADEPKPEPSEQQPQGEGDPRPPQPGAESPQEAGKPEDKPSPGKPVAGEPRQDAPGEGLGDLELTPEETQRLLEKLKQMDQQLRALRLRAGAGRRPVERDW